jgi:hypothetical protein
LWSGLLIECDSSPPAVLRPLDGQDDDVPVVRSAGHHRVADGAVERRLLVL